MQPTREQIEKDIHVTETMLEGIRQQIALGNPIPAFLPPINQLEDLLKTLRELKANL